MPGKHTEAFEWCQKTERKKDRRVPFIKNAEEQAGLELHAVDVQIHYFVEGIILPPLSLACLQVNWFSCVWPSCD